jgi:hypothetical protein
LVEECSIPSAKSTDFGSFNVQIQPLMTTARNGTFISLVQGAPNGGKCVDVVGEIFEEGMEGREQMTKTAKFNVYPAGSSLRRQHDTPLSAGNPTFCRRVLMALPAWSPRNTPSPQSRAGRASRPPSSAELRADSLKWENITEVYLIPPKLIHKCPLPLRYPSLPYAPPV